VIDRVESPLQIKGKYFPFPETPKEILIQGIAAHEYVGRVELGKIIDEFSRQVNLNWYDVLCVNLRGGVYFANELFKRQTYGGKVVTVEYHEDGTVVTPVPEGLVGHIAVIDDVLDKYITGSMIQRDAPSAQLLYLTKKPATPSNNISKCVWACEVDNVWLLGAGMNGEMPGDGLPTDWGREFSGIAAKIQ
jgi:hypoxanthine-guanine phosphoribosyltransferase